MTRTTVPVHSSSETKEEGFAILAALSVIVILAGVVYLLADLGYSIKRSSSVYLWTAQGSAVADGAIYSAIADLSEAKIELAYGGVGIESLDVPHGWSVDVTIEVELAKVDLNLATRQNFLDLLQFNGVDAQSADKISDQILDWRDSDGNRRLHGAEAADYKSLGLDYVPRDAPFERLQELMFIPKVSKELFEKLERQLTVYSANYNATQTAVREIVNASKMKVLLPKPEGFAYTIKAKAVRASGAVVYRRAIIRLTSNSNERYLVYHWGDGRGGS